MGVKAERDAIVAAFLRGDAISDIELSFDLPRVDIEPILRKAWLAERKRHARDK